MAIKKTKKSPDSVSDTEEESNSPETSRSEDTESIKAEVVESKGKKELSSDDKAKLYKVYDVDVEFKLKEVESKDGKVLIGPNRLTRFEKARITGARSLQLSLGAPILSKIPSELTDTIMIARYELEKKTLPISIRRILPNGLYQDIPLDWTV